MPCRTVGIRLRAAICLLPILLGLAGCVSPGARELSGLREARKEAARRPRRIIMNHDGNFYGGKPEHADKPRTAEDFLKKRIWGLAEPSRSQVDAVFYCTGVFDLYSHRSQESEWKTSGSNRWDYAYELATTGRDDLQTVVDFCHEHGMEAFWSMRMNDTHDSDTNRPLARWKSAHPECLMGAPGQKFPHGASRWSSVDYGQAASRDKVFCILRDVCTRYDVDGVELDFFRHPVLFKPQMTGDPVTPEHAGLLTDLLRRVRRMTEQEGLKRGRPLLVAVRVPDSEGFCLALGMDVSRWMEEDLIDLLVVSGYFRLNPWKTSAEWGHRYGVPVYASLDESRLKDPHNAMQQRPEGYRGRAMQAWADGVDGIYTFNLFNAALPLYREMGDPTTLRRLDKLWGTGARPLRPNYWLKDGIRHATRQPPLPESPRTLRPGTGTAVELEVADRWEEEADRPRAEAWLYFRDMADPGAVSVRCNGKPAGAAVARDGWLVCPLPRDAVATGANSLEVTLNAGAPGPAKLENALLWLRYSPPSSP